jgi:hypothetical protein
LRAAGLQLGVGSNGHCHLPTKTTKQNKFLGYVMIHLNDKKSFCSDNSGYRSLSHSQLREGQVSENFFPILF